MPKSALQAELNAIIATLRSHENGLPVAKIGELSQLALPYRTLQRRLATLAKNGQLQVIGSGRGTLYKLAPQFELTSSLTNPQPKLVTYNRKFLDDYQPNVTSYLSEKNRLHLWEIGKSFQHQRPAGTYAREILSRLLIDLSWNSSRLEGNTYSLLETERLLSSGETADDRSSFETQMILNHKNAIEFLVDTADEITFNRYTILNLHALLSDNLLGNSEASGRLRAISVAIHGTVFRPLAIPQLIDECFQQVLDKAAAINDPYEQAFFAMVQFPYLQPFEDVNKRVSRLAANIPFIKNNLCPLSFTDVSDQAYIDSMLSVYEFNRIELLRDLFIWAYERSALRYSAIQHSLGEPDPFRLRYRAQISETINLVVNKMMDKKTAASFIQQQATVHIPQEHRMRYIEVVETELLGLHAGNIARYHIRPSEFELWHNHWR